MEQTSTLKSKNVAQLTAEVILTHNKCAYHMLLFTLASEIITHSGFAAMELDMSPMLSVTAWARMS